MSRGFFVALRNRTVTTLLALATLATLLAVVHADPALAGGISLSTDRWDVNTDTGVVSYELTLNVTGAAASGQPCQSYCRWRIEAWYRDGTVEKFRQNLASGPGDMTNDFTLTRTMTATRLPEITHVRAVLAPNYEGSWTTWTSGWKQVSSPYPDGGIDVIVNSWDANVDTGVVNYDVVMRWHGAGQDQGPCVSYCRWNLVAYYKDGTVEQAQGAPLTSGSLYSAGVWSETIPLKKTITGEITHLKATLAPYDSASNNDTYTTWKHVHAPYPQGTADTVIRTWSFDPATGMTTYNLTGDWKGAAQVGGPCVSYCRWTLAAYQRSATTETQVAMLRSLTVYAGNSWTTDFAASGSFPGIATHVKATLEPYDAASPNEKYVRWISTGEPATGESISLTVPTWLVDRSSGKASYSLVLAFAAAALPNGPCENVRCQYEIEAWTKDSSGQTKIATLYSGECLSGCWGASVRVSAANASLGNVTHLRAHVYPSSGACPAPCSREIFDTDLIFVGDSTSADTDLVPYEIALAGYATNPGALCASLTVAGGMFPSTQGTTTSDVVNACSKAATAPNATLRTVIIAIALATGGIAALVWLVEQDENPTAEPHPTPEEDANRPLPWLPGPTDEDNGCEQDLVTIAPKDRKHVVDGHTWGARKGKSEFYGHIDWEWLATVYALKVRAIPSGTQCVRRVTYTLGSGLPRNVGIDRDIDFAPTPVYSVVTRPDGSLVSSYPGNATIWPVP